MFGALSIALAGCGPRLPDCFSGLPKPEETGKTPVGALKPGRKVLIGIDGSGSMLGFAQAGNNNVWRRFLQAINQGVLLEGLQPVTYRIGAGVAEGPLGASVTKAADPCFFQGCAGFRPVASSLETLWTATTDPKALPLRLLVSDLEVNQNDISSLLAGIQADLTKGASAGILGLRIPFTGDVFSADGRIIFKGKTSRPVFVLASGPKKQVKSVLAEISKALARNGMNDASISIVDPDTLAKTMTAKSVVGIPATSASPGSSVRILGQTYRPSQNPDYQFIKLNAAATGLSVATATNVSGGSERPAFGITDLEQIDLARGQSVAAEGVRVSNIQISGSNLKVQLNVDESAPSGLYRVVVPAGSLPEQWWLDWDRAQTDTTKVGEKTQGLLLLMTSLSRQVAKTTKGPPAAALCIALQNQN